MTDIKHFDPKRTYDEAAVNYARATSLYWPQVTARAAKLLDLRPGSKVLDVACGPGDLALHAAEAVGPQGSAVGVDISEPMLDIARANAARRELTNVEFRYGDMHGLAFHPETFDAIGCSFGLFFATDITEVIRAMWRRLRPGGTLVVVTLTDEFFTPAYDVFHHAASRDIRDAEIDELTPWRRTERAPRVAEYFREAGVTDLHVEADRIPIAFEGMETWDLIQTGTGIRRIVDALGPLSMEGVSAAMREYCTTRAPNEIRLGALYFQARKPQL